MCVCVCVSREAVNRATDKQFSCDSLFSKVNGDVLD